MIIFYFLSILFSCRLHKNRQSDIQGYRASDIRLYRDLTSVDNIDEEVRSLIEKGAAKHFESLAQLYVQKGMQTGDFEDFVKARSFAFSCLSREDVFRVEFLEPQRLHPERIDIESTWASPQNCSEERFSSILSLPSNRRLVACATWAVMSWTKITQAYQMEHISIDSDRILYLALWLGEHRDCLDWPWIPLALSLSIAQAREDLVEQKELAVWMERFFTEAEQSELRIDAFLERLHTSLQNSSFSAEQRKNARKALDAFLSEPLRGDQRDKIIAFQALLSE